VIGERFQTSAIAQPQAVGELRRAVAAYAKALGASEAASEAVKLAVSEALTNVVVHAYVNEQPGAMILEAWLDDEGYLLVLVSDEGVGMVPRTDSPGLGVGMSLMAQMADDVRVISRQSRGTMLSLRFSLNGSPSRADAQNALTAGNSP
jgi:serine/threonine-protein kinase RsbW